MGGWVAWSNLVSAQGPLVLDLRLKGLGPGLDNLDFFTFALFAVFPLGQV